MIELHCNVLALIFLQNYSVIEVLESVADNLAVNDAVGDDEVVTVLSFVGNTSALLVERVSSLLQQQYSMLSILVLLV